MHIEELGFTQDFKTRSAYMGYRNLRQIIDTPQVVLEAKREFSSQWMEELIAYAEQCEFVEQLFIKDEFVM